MPEDSPTGNAPAATAPARERESREEKKARIQCEFCECTVSPHSGDVIKVSDKAKALRDSEEKVSSLTKENEGLRTQLQEAKDKIRDLTVTPPGPKKPERTSGITIK